MTIRRMLLALVGAAILLGALVSAASAGRLEISNQALRGTFRSIEFIGEFGTARCQVTMEGSFHSRTTVKTIGSLVGYLTRAILGPCASGAATILTETLPWHIRYSGFEGVLPEIRSIIAHIIGGAWRVREPGMITCLARSTAARPSVISFHREPVTHAVTGANVTGRIPTGPECFGVEGAFTSDSGSITVSNSTTRISISLI
jgi:hypothetical protein